MDVDLERRRISLSLRAANEELGLEDADPGCSRGYGSEDDDAETVEVEGR